MVIYVKIMITVYKEFKYILIDFYIYMYVYIRIRNLLLFYYSGC